MISIKNLNAYYGWKKVLKDISLDESTFKRGEIFTLIGPNGSGKSTFLKALLNWMKIRGELNIFGKPIHQLSQEERHRIGYVSQLKWFSLKITVYEVLLIALKCRYKWKSRIWMHEKIEGILKRLDICHFKHSYINQLSGGQVQMVFIAQALIRDPEILLLDEPISALDLKYQMWILEMILDYTQSQNIITIMTLHDLNMACRFSSKLGLLKRGRIIKIGASKDIITQEMIKEHYQVKANVYDHNDSLSIQLISSIF